MTDPSASPTRHPHDGGHTTAQPAAPLLWWKNYSPAYGPMIRIGRLGKVKVVSITVSMMREGGNYVARALIGEEKEHHSNDKVELENWGERVVAQWIRDAGLRPRSAEESKG